MKTIKMLFIVLAILSTEIIFAQDTNYLGFSCGYGRKPTSSVKIMDNLVEKLKFKTIRNNLFAHDNATKCLAVIICEILDKKGYIKLTINERVEIKKAYKSERLVIICSGCTLLKKTTIKNLLNEKYYRSQKHNYRGCNQNFREQVQRRYIDKIKGTNI